MQTEPWVEQKHAIWNVLPLHPHPEKHESLTSYMMRLASVNGLQSMHELLALAGIQRYIQQSWSNFADYPAASGLSGLAQITGCPQERLFSTTFLPLVQRFGRSTHPGHLRRFFQGSLTSLYDKKNYKRRR